MADPQSESTTPFIDPVLAELVISVRERHLDLVELICDAANAGVEPWMEAVFVARTRWFRDHWGDVRRRLAPWLTAHPDDLLRGIRMDPFEMLFRPESVAAVLAADDGSMIGRLARCQSILEAWEAAVRRGEVRS